MNGYQYIPVTLEAGGTAKFSSRGTSLFFSWTCLERFSVICVGSRLKGQCKVLTFMSMTSARDATWNRVWRDSVDE